MIDLDIFYRFFFLDIPHPFLEIVQNLENVLSCFKSSKSFCLFSVLKEKNLWTILYIKPSLMKTTLTESIAEHLEIHITC